MILPFREPNSVIFRIVSDSFLLPCYRASRVFLVNAVAIVIVIVFFAVSRRVIPVVITREPRVEGFSEFSEQTPTEILEYFSKPFSRPNGLNEERVDVSSKAKRILTGTLEGQEFLELVISERTDLIAPLNISVPTKEDTNVRYIDDMRLNEGVKDEQSDKWRVDEDYERNIYVEENKEELQLEVNKEIQGKR